MHPNRLEIRRQTPPPLDGRSCLKIDWSNSESGTVSFSHVSVIAINLGLTALINALNSFNLLQILRALNKINVESVDGAGWKLGSTHVSIKSLLQSMMQLDKET